MRKEVRRQERIKISLAGQVVLSSGSTVPAKILDISMTGMKIEMQHNMAIDEEVRIVIEDSVILELKTKIVWGLQTHNKRVVEYGLKFICVDRAFEGKLGTYIENKLKALTEREVTGRRKFLRISTAFTARLRKITGNNQECKGFIKDLSLGGMNLICRDEFIVGDKIKFSFPFQGATAFETKGEVVRKTKIKNFISYGIKFMAVSFEEESQLKNYISLRIKIFHNTPFPLRGATPFC